MRNRRGKRVDLARREQRVAALEARFLENEVLSAAARAFVDALTAQQRVQNSSELTRLAEETHRVVSERIAAGRVSPIEGTRSTVVLESARLEEARARRELRSARVRLASFWGGAASDVDAVEGTFEPPPPAPPEAPTAVDHPEIALTTAEIEARDADLVLQKAASAPDLTVSGGVRYLREYGAVAVLGGVSIELPVSDRNQGAVAAAAARVRQATLRRTAVEKRIDAELEQARIALETCRAEAGKLMELALPSAKDALAGLEEGYRQGKFDYLSVLDAQRTYIEIRARHIAAIAEALGAAVELEKLSGRAGKSGAFAFLQPGRGGLNAGEK
jgi:cobalt-zinc-cadmium efflux system outer membrane protein